jgi:hypothetical protein
MENKIVEGTKTVAKDIVEVPVAVGTVVVQGAETLGRDVKDGVVVAGTAVVDATKTAVSTVADSGRELGQGVKKVVLPTPDPTMPKVAPEVVAVAA